MEIIIILELFQHAIRPRDHSGREDEAAISLYDDVMWKMVEHGALLDFDYHY